MIIFTRNSAILSAILQKKETVSSSEDVPTISYRTEPTC